MEKRSELKKQEIKGRKERFKFIISLLLCIIFFLSAIYITDNSINNLLLDESDTHAIYMNLDESNLKVEIVGKEYNVNIEQLKKGMNIANSYIKKYYSKLKTYIYSKI